MMLKRSSSNTGCPIEASSSHKMMILSICACVSSPSFSLSLPNCHHSSAPTTMECCLKRVLSVLKYSYVLFLLVRWVKRELARVLVMICWTFASFLTQVGRVFAYSVTALTLSGVVIIHLANFPAAGSMGSVVVPSRYLLSPQLATTIWSQTFQVVHSLPDASSLGSLTSSDVVLVILMNICTFLCSCFSLIRVQGS